MSVKSALALALQIGPGIGQAVDNPAVDRVIGEGVPATSRPSMPARMYGLGSVFGKSLRDSTPAMLGVALLLGLVVLVTMVAIGDQFDTLEERQALAQQMELLPDFFQGLLGPAIALDTLPGFLSWRLVGIMPLMIGLWSVTALGATLASEASRGTLEMVLATPLRRHSLAVQKFLGHVVALGLALAFISIVAWLASIAFAKLPGDEMSLVTALSEFAMVGGIALFAGALAFMASNLFGRTVGIGIGGGYLFAAFAINGYAGLVPGFDILRLGSVFYWTQGHRPMAGSSDWPAVAFVFAMAAVFGVAGVASFVRRDLNSPISLSARLRRGDGSRFGVGLGLGRLSVGRWSLGGPGARSVADRLPEAVGWGVAMGMYGLFVAFAADSFAQVINSVPQIATMVSMFYPNFDFESVGGILQFAIFAFIALVVGLAASSLVHGWSSDEREGRLETVLSTPIRRVAWFLRSAGGLFVAVLLMGLLIGLGPAIGAAAQGDAWPPLFAGGLVLGLYGAALVGVGLAVGGAGWPNIAALAVGAFTIAFYLLDLLGGLLGLPDELLNLSLTRHLGQPMVSDYDWPGMLACLALAAGGLLFGAWRFSRRDLRGA